MDATPAVTVIHNADEHRYEVRIGETLAVAEYELDGDRMIFTHTLVPPELRGRRIAELLVRAGLADARAASRRVVPQCSYVDKFIQLHREYQDLLADG